MVVIPAVLPLLGIYMVELKAFAWTTRSRRAREEQSWKVAGCKWKATDG
jgi:hypothetical protein